MIILIAVVFRLSYGNGALPDGVPGWDPFAGVGDKGTRGDESKPVRAIRRGPHVLAQPILERRR